jgi:hypothetical protein
MPPDALKNENEPEIISRRKSMNRRWLGKLAKSPFQINQNDRFTIIAFRFVLAYS